MRLFDLERYPLPTDLDGDVFVCTEVAEHLPASAADRLVDLVCLATRWVVFTAAPPGQGGVDHVNEQPREYWMEKFNARGFVEDTAMTEALRADWLGSPISDFIPANLMVFSSTR